MVRTEQEEIDMLMATVDKFAVSMKAVLTERVKQGKRGWDLRELQDHIKAELLTDAYTLLDDDDLPKPQVAVDCANRAMFLWHIHQGETAP